MRQTKTLAEALAGTGDMLVERLSASFIRSDKFRDLLSILVITVSTQCIMHPCTLHLLAAEKVDLHVSPQKEAV